MLHGHRRHHRLDDIGSKPGAGARDVQHQQQVTQVQSIPPSSRQPKLSDSSARGRHTIASLVPTANEAPGCRDTAIATGFLLGFGIVMFAIGLTLINRDNCAGACEIAGLSLLYAGGPFSALIGFFTDTVVICLAPRCDALGAARLWGCPLGRKS